MKKPEPKPQVDDDYPNEENPFGGSDYGGGYDDPADEPWWQDSKRKLPNVGR